MKKVLTTIALSLSALVATSAMAAPQHHDPRYAPHKSAPHWNHKDAKKWDDRRYNNRGVNPSRDWRVGQVLPRYWDQSRNEVNYRHYKGLNKPGRYQQWYKINGDFVLVNERNNRIVRIIN